MATTEHCLLCFEALAADLENRPPMSLSQVQQSYIEYSASQSSDPNQAADTEEDSKSTTQLKKTLISQLARASNSSTPDTNSSTSSLSNTTAQTTPSGSGTFTPISTTPDSTAKPSTITESPLFVTWNTLSPSSSLHHEKSLRGCIGTFSSLPLVTALPSYALTSALSDTRFAPIAADELPSLSVSVTLLTDFEPCEHPLDWDVGTHGIKLSFRDRGRRYSACYLPDVAVEQGWSREEAVVSAMRKGGWGGRKSAWREVTSLEVVRFRGEADHLDYEEFKDWREWEDKHGEGRKRK